VNESQKQTPQETPLGYFISVISNTLHYSPPLTVRPRTANVGENGGFVRFVANGVVIQIIQVRFADIHGSPLPILQHYPMRRENLSLRKPHAKSISFFGKKPLRAKIPPKRTP
jgi:hypothetical protein